MNGRKPPLWTVTALALVVSLVVPWVVLADNLVNNLDTTVDPTEETVTIPAGGSAIVGFYIQATTGGGDPGGCNATGNDPAYLTVTPPAGVTVSWTGYPNPLEFVGCGTTALRYITFSSSTPGSYTIANFSMTGGKPGSQWNYETAKFILIVTPSDTTPPIISYSISGTKGNGDWYISDVFVDWEVTDPESAVTILEGCVDTTIDSDTAGVTLICRAQSAGGTSQASVTIQRDATPPFVIVTPEREPDHGGWYNAPIGFTVSGSDDTSGLASCTEGGTYSGPDSASVSFQASCRDNAGNIGYGSHDFKYDATAPSISGSASPAANTYGWNNTDVTVSFTCSDAPSGVAFCGPDAILTAEEADQYVTGTAEDNAGNSASVTVGPINIDKTPPVVEATASPAPNAYGWNNTDVTITWNWADGSGSGLDSCTESTVASAEGQYDVTDSCKDRAGNEGTASYAVKIDKTPPFVIVTPEREPDHGGWYNAPIGFTVSGSDDTSGLASCTEGGTYSGPDSASVSFQASCRDNAGNIGYGSHDFKYDATAPSISGSASPAANEYGWNNTDVTVSFTCSDAPSGVASCGPDATLTDEGKDKFVTGTAKDNAGNSASATVGPINIDKTPPVVVATASPAPNAHGWNNTDVVVSFSGTDALSGIAGCDADVVLSGEGAGQSATGSCTDRAGNSASATASGINIDKTPPSIIWSNGPVDGGVYYYGFVPPAPTCTAADGLSGPNGCTVTGYSNAVGTHTMTATARDKAGNVKAETRIYTVRAWTLSGFYQPVDMGGVWNVVKGGSTVPLKFEIFAGPTELTDTAYVKSFAAAQVSCTGGSGEDEVEFTTTGGTVLRYDPVAGQFIQNWQTPKKPGFCYRVTMTTQDGSSLVALFKLK